jgi:hypothetical protein
MEYQHLRKDDRKNKRSTIVNHNISSITDGRRQIRNALSMIFLCLVVISTYGLSEAATKVASPLASKYMNSTLFGFKLKNTSLKPPTNIHNGIDIAADKNEPVFSLCDGTVRLNNTNRTDYSTSQQAYWNSFLIVDHNCDGRKITAYYGHVKSTLSPSANVKAGDKIAVIRHESGNTDHLHLSINGKYLPNGWGYNDSPAQVDSYGFTDPRKDLSFQNAGSQQSTNRLNAIKQLYHEILGREADQGGLNGYASHNQPLEAIRQCMLNSAECRQGKGGECKKRYGQIAARYCIRISNIDDQGTCKVNGDTVKTVGYYQDTQWVDITNKLHPGKNEIKFKVTNKGGGYAYHFGVQKNGSTIWQEKCGEVGKQSCTKKRLNNGDTLTKTYEFAL